MNSIKIAFTGGPCGGKSTSLNYFKEQLKKENYNIGIVSETATELLSLGILPGNNITLIDFQNLLFKIQFIKEYKKENEKQILLCDRGLLDGNVYLENNAFEKILFDNRIKKDELISTYDGVLYFKTIANDFPEKFKLMRKYETPEVGITRDKKCYMVWLDKIINDECDNQNGIEFKQVQLFDYLIKHLDSIDMTKTKTLSDYYDINHLNFIKNSIDNIFNKSIFSDDQIQKVRRLTI
ncbi:MAG TPA: ATP-binding protein [Bacilli bacterium]|nr:ATP-binding protein [Bacilli bacterium]